MTNDFTIITKSEKETQDFGSKFAEKLKDKDIIALYGELGSGKTQLVKGICKSLGTPQTVNSPTFIIVNEYTSEKFPGIYHFDFYRMKHYDDVISTGFEDYINKRGIVFIEWPELVEDMLPKDTIKIHLGHTSENEDYRCIRLEYPRK